MHRIRTARNVAAFVVVALALPALAAEPSSASSAAVLVSSAELKWSDVPDAPGVKMAPIHGDPAKGPAHFFFRLPAGFTAGMHFHNADHWVAVISGTMLLTPEGGAEKRLGAGSGFGFTGKKKHTTKCAEGADCVLFVDCRGPWDIVPVDSGKP